MLKASRDAIFSGEVLHWQRRHRPARWIRSVAKETPDGLYWLPEPDHPDNLTTVSSRLGLYSGSSGVVLFLLQLAGATRDDSYLRSASRGADYLAAHWRDDLAVEPASFLRSPFAFYGGQTGAAFTLAETWKATGEAKYERAAREATDLLVSAAKPRGAGHTWTGSPAVGFGDSGVLLYLLYAASLFRQDSYRQAALAAGAYILGEAEHDPRGGLRWLGIRGDVAGIPKDVYFPNFEIGTAGTAYALARLYSETKNPRFLDAAEQGALHLITKDHEYLE